MFLAVHCVKFLSYFLSYFFLSCCILLSYLKLIEMYGGIAQLTCYYIILICMIFSSYSSLERDCPTRSLRMLPHFFSFDWYCYLFFLNHFPEKNEVRKKHEDKQIGFGTRGKKRKPRCYRKKQLQPCDNAVTNCCYLFVLAVLDWFSLFIFHF